MKTYHLGQQIQCISANADVSLLSCLVGKDVLKVLRVEPLSVADADTPSDDEPSIQLVRTYKHWGARARYPIGHVAWNPHKSHEHIIVGGAMNGQLIFWTLGTSNYTTVPVTMEAHQRAVRRVVWHRESASCLLSVSTDSVQKLWDTRDTSAPVATFRNPAHFVATDAVFSHLDTHMVAVAFSNGNVHTYDDRMPSAPVWTKRAHNAGAYCLAWHPTGGGVLSSGGRDRYIHVWDTNTDQELASLNCVTTPSRIAWRPMPDGSSSTQIACNSVAGSVNVPTELETRVAVWDTRYPNLPSRTLLGNRNYVTDLMWASAADSIFTSSRDGMVSRLVLRDGNRPYEELPSAALAVDKFFDHMAFCHEEVCRDVGVDGHVPSAMKVEDNPFSRIPPNRPVGQVRIAHTPFLSDSRAQFVALATEYSVRSTNRKSTCEDNALIADNRGAGESAALWRICAGLEEEANSVLAQQIRKRFIWDTTKRLSAIGKFQMSIMLACVYRSLNDLGLESAEHVARSAQLYSQVLRSVDLIVEAREIRGILGLNSWMPLS
ncbi:hypothetical protein NDN08_000134 [Rhodosorus marinus]|uniref:Uncharacterized protein n=1 Tax=Rhodosorus marinus TaxID=101924 RepID=A0AAV8UEB5_9RHOD|nr:hypothetical protein NDN08_000134 [Rhodosorus marinus]